MYHCCKEMVFAGAFKVSLVILVVLKGCQSTDLFITEVILSASMRTFNVVKPHFFFYSSEPQFCNDPGSLPNAGRNPPTGTQFNTGSQVFYNCNNCYRGGGPITCQSGVWFPSPTPACNRKYLSLWNVP